MSASVPFEEVEARSLGPKDKDRTRCVPYMLYYVIPMMQVLP